MELRHKPVPFHGTRYLTRINDTWGHRAGDAILYQVSQRLRTTLRLEDFVGRYGGEEFAIVLPASTLETAYQAAERLRVAVAAQPCTWLSEEAATPVTIPVTASLGIAVYQVHGVTREALVEHADQAMYQAKRSGRNKVCIAEVEMEPVQELLSSTKEVTTEASTLQALTAAASAQTLMHTAWYALQKPRLVSYNDQKRNFT